MQGLRVALKVCLADTGEEVFTRFAKPSRLIQELSVIQEHKSWIVTETYIANKYGIKMEVDA